MSYNQPPYQGSSYPGNGSYPQGTYNHHDGYQGGGYQAYDPSQSGYVSYPPPQEPYNDHHSQKKGSTGLIIALTVVLVVFLVVLGIVVKTVFFSGDDTDQAKIHDAPTTQTPSASREDRDPQKTKPPKKKDNTTEDDLKGRSNTHKAQPDFRAPDSAVSGRSFQVPGKNIGCELKGGVWGCTMEMSADKDCGNGVVSYVIDPSGLQGRTCGTKFLGEEGDYVPTLYPGDYWQNGSYACKIITDTSIRCWNTNNGEGFLLDTNFYEEHEGEMR